MAEVESDYIKTKLTPASIYDTWADQQLGNRITQEGSYIDKLCFDKYRGVYYCFIQDKVSEGRQVFFVYNPILSLTSIIKATRNEKEKVSVTHDEGGGV